MKTTFDGLSDTEVIPRTGAVLANLANDPNLYNYILSLLPTQAHLQEAHDRHQESFSAALTGASDKVMQRTTDRRLVNRRFSAFAALVQLAALEDPDLPARLSLDSKERASSPTPALTAPGNFKVWHGEAHGTMHAKCSSVKTAKSFLMEICEGDPTIEENWKFGAVSSTCTAIFIEGLVPGRVYSFRVRAIRSSGPGPWSSYITLMAI
jgi:hypothetical protein